MYDNSKTKFIIPLRNAIIMHAEYFLKTQKGEFHPFGCAIDADEKMISIGGYLGEEFGDPNELIQFFEKSMKKDLLEGKLLLCAIGIDGLIRIEGFEEKQPVVKIRIIDVDGDILHFLLHYSVDEEYNVSWLEDSVEEV